MVKQEPPAEAPEPPALQAFSASTSNRTASTWISPCTSGGKSRCNLDYLRDEIIAKLLGMPLREGASQVVRIQAARPRPPRGSYPWGQARPAAGAGLHPPAIACIPRGRRTCMAGEIVKIPAPFVAREQGHHDLDHIRGHTPAPIWKSSLPPGRRLLSTPSRPVLVGYPMQTALEKTTSNSPSYRSSCASITSQERLGGYVGGSCRGRNRSSPGSCLCPPPVPTAPSAQSPR